MAKQSREDRRRRQMDRIRFFARYAGIGMEMFVTLMVMAYLGHYLDGRFHLEKPYLTVLFALIGLGAVLFRIVKLLGKP